MIGPRPGKRASAPSRAQCGACTTKHRKSRPRCSRLPDGVKRATPEIGVETGGSRPPRARVQCSGTGAPRHGVARRRASSRPRQVLSREMAKMRVLHGVAVICWWLPAIHSTAIICGFSPLRREGMSRGLLRLRQGIEGGWKRLLEQSRLPETSSWFPGTGS